MQNTDANYTTILSDPTHRFRVQLIISDPDGSNPQTFGTDKMFSLRTNCRVYENTPTIGGCYSSTCEFSLLDDGSTIPKMARCEIVWSATDGTIYSSAMNKGVFYIDTRTVKSNGGGLNVFEAFCYDTMMFANQPYNPGSVMRWPALDTSVITNICGILGIGEDPRNAYYINSAYTLPGPTEGTTIRDYLSYIAVMYAGNWIISDDNELRFIPLCHNVAVIPGYNHDYFVYPGDLISLENGATQPPYDKVVIKTSDNTSFSSGNGSDERVLEAFCPFATQSITDSVFNKLVTGFVSFDAEAISDPAVELNDLFLYCTDPDDPSGSEVFNSRITSRTIDFGSMFKLQMGASNEQDVSHEIIYIEQSERDYDDLAESTADLSDTVTGGLRNLIINTKVPSVSDLPALVEQVGPTYFQNYTPTPAIHGIRLTKDTSTSASVLFAFGETSNNNIRASMCGLEAGGTYTLSFDWAYTLFASSADDTYMRWRLLSWDSTSSGATMTQTEFIREEITRNTATTKAGVKGTFTVPEDAVVLCVYMDFITSSGGVDTVIANSAVRSTDYYEFANLMMQRGVNATEWTAAPEDEDTLEGVTSFINSSGIQNAQINASGLSFYDSSGTVTANFNADRANNLVSVDGSSKSITSATSGMANLCSFKLGPGLWIVSCMVRCATNATGYRYAIISTSATGTTSINENATLLCAPANGNTTRMPIVTAINVSSSTTYYLNVRQNSGSTLTCYGNVRAVKVS